MLQYKATPIPQPTVAQQSQVRADRLTPFNQACLAAVEARAHGERGDGQNCLVAARRAEQHFAAVVPDDEAPAMLSYHSPARLAGDTGQALLPVAMRGHHPHPRRVARVIAVSMTACSRPLRLARH